METARPGRGCLQQSRRERLRGNGVQLYWGLAWGCCACMWVLLLPQLGTGCISPQSSWEHPQVGLGPLLPPPPQPGTWGGPHKATVTPCASPATGNCQHPSCSLQVGHRMTPAAPSHCSSPMGTPTAGAGCLPLRSPLKSQHREGGWGGSPAPQLCGAAAQLAAGKLCFRGSCAPLAQGLCACR